MSVFGRLRAWRRRRLLRRHPLDDELWRAQVAGLEVLGGLDDGELARLRDLTTLFVHDKRLYGTHDLEVDAGMAIAIGAQACLLLLNLDDGTALDVYPGWHSVILYPGAFVARHDWRDSVGVVHERVMALDGEASHRGPVALSWADARPRPRSHGDARNVVLHEFAHKLDDLDGDTNGHPPLHRGMSTRTWSRVFGAAYDDLREHLARGRHPPIDPYAATSPAEFFAVATEVFFEQPHQLQHAWPELYAQLEAYYRQDPGRRRPAAGTSGHPHRSHATHGRDRST